MQKINFQTVLIADKINMNEKVDTGMDTEIIPDVIPEEKKPIEPPEEMDEDLMDEDDE